VKKSNKLRTTKYTLISWAPLSLLFQFKRAANIYFLMITILTAQYFSPKSPGSMIGTFAAVLFFTMLKEAYEDYQRYKSDLQINARQTYVHNPDGQDAPKRWDQIRVGEIIRVDKDDQVPADILCINGPSESKNIVFISTMNLDGETNLKDKVIPFEKLQKD
jgi:magnesium-transporting ATPase (P-type)